jgi:amidase
MRPIVLHLNKPAFHSVRRPRNLARTLEPPTREQLREHAARHRVELAEADVDDELANVAGALELFAPLADLQDPRIPLVPGERDAGRPPTDEEDPHHAIIRFCRVTGAETGPLAGMRFGVKDNIAVAGVPMSGGRRGPAPVPTEDAVVVERLLGAGATIVAKTSVGDGRQDFPLTKNPLNPRFFAGGSSSGSAAAVAAGLVDAALGADQGGSIRMPAASCGLVGMKATHGLVPSYGSIHWDHTLDCLGPITRTVADNAAVLEVIAGGDWRDPQWVRADPIAGDYASAAGEGVGGLRIGVLTESTDHCTPAALAAFERAQETLAALGAEVVPASVPLWSAAPAIWAMVATIGVSVMADSLGQGYGHLGRIDVDRMEETASRYLEHGPDLPPFPFSERTLPLVFEHIRTAYRGVPFGRAQNLRLELRRQIDERLGEVQLLVAPTSALGPAELTELKLRGAALRKAVASVFAPAMGTTCPLNLTGHPALTVPSGPGDHDLPTGLQIIGRRFDERTVYRAGFAFEAAGVAA